MRCMYIFHDCMSKSSSPECLLSDKYYCCWFPYGERSLLCDKLFEASGLVTWRRSSCLFSLFMGLWLTRSNSSLSPWLNCIFYSSSWFNCDISVLFRFFEALKVVKESCMSSLRLICWASVCLTIFSLKTTSSAIITEYKVKMGDHS